MAQNSDRIEVEALVSEKLPNNQYRLKLDNGALVLAQVSGKMRLNNINILIGDSVVVELSPYDLSRGRIVYRKKK